MIKEKIISLRQFFSVHFEWIAFTVGLLAMGMMNPYAENGPSFCLFDLMNFPYCPGEGLGHSIAFTFRGDLSNALEANILGPLSIVILMSRIIYLLHDRVVKNSLGLDKKTSPIERL